MPYKDVEQRRTYMREYKRRQKRLRAAQPHLKVYLCVRHPHLRIGGSILFQDGFYVTASREEQEVIEAYEGYGVFIVGWRAEPDAGRLGRSGVFLL
jgi:hypothetical protein